MNVGGIKWTPKMRAVLNDKVQIKFLGGATGTSKTLIVGMDFMGEMFNAPADRTQYFIIFRDIGTGLRNFLENKDSFFKQVRAEEITRVLDTYFETGICEDCKTLLTLIKSDLLVLEYIAGRRELAA